MYVCMYVCVCVCVCVMKIESNIMVEKIQFSIKSNVKEKIIFNKSNYLLKPLLTKHLV